MHSYCKIRTVTLDLFIATYSVFGQIVAQSCGVNFVSIDGAEMYSCYVGESESLLRKVFVEARSKAPCILFLDEMDALVGSRSIGDRGGGVSGSSNGNPSGKDVVQERILSTLLNEMDGIEPLQGVVIIVNDKCLKLHSFKHTSPCGCATGVLTLIYREPPIESIE